MCPCCLQVHSAALYAAAVWEVCVVATAASVLEYIHCMYKALAWTEAGECTSKAVLQNAII